ncbi:MAG: FTR1 family protein, partial [bacterium]|nr:FTR1 family protein [bacterium]
KDVSKKIKDEVARHTEKGYGFGVFVLVASSVFREGTETVLYLKASSLVGQSNQILGAVFGIILALILGIGLFKMSLKIKLSMVFNITSVFLLMFAAGLVSHGVHEFQEIGMLPVYAFDPLFNISHILDHKSVFGSFLRILFGYTSKPTFLELASYMVYVFAILGFQKYRERVLVGETV